MKKLMALLAGAFLLTQPAMATYRLPPDGGGNIEEYFLKYETIRAAHDRVVVPHECLSACTILLSVLPYSQVCVTEDTLFGFHSAKEQVMPMVLQFSKDGTEWVYESYPAWVKKIINDGGWDGKSEHPDLVMVTGKSLYPLCSDPWYIKIGRALGLVKVPVEYKDFQTWRSAHEKNDHKKTKTRKYKNGLFDPPATTPQPVKHKPKTIHKPRPVVTKCPELEPVLMPPCPELKFHWWLTFVTVGLWLMMALFVVRHALVRLLQALRRAIARKILGTL